MSQEALLARRSRSAGDPGRACPADPDLLHFEFRFEFRVFDDVVVTDLTNTGK